MPEDKSKKPVDLTMGLKTKPNFKPLIHPDGTIEQIEEGEWNKFVENNPNSRTAIAAKKEKDDSTRKKTP